MSSKILRKAVIEEAPLLIDNSFVLPLYVDDEPRIPTDLVEALQFENPDAEPDEIEDALQEVMDQLRDAPSEFGAGASLELEETDLEADAFQAFEEEAQAEPAPFESAFEPFAADAEETPTAVANLGGQDTELAAEAARQVLAEADARAAEIERAAYDKGYAEGLDAGRVAGEEQAAEMARQVMAIVDQATELHDTMLREAESEMVALCLEVARKVVQTELSTNAEVVTSILSEAVRKINGSPRVTIKVHPDQVEAVRGYWDSAFGADYREKEWIIEGDPSVGAGGCVLDTKYGSLDARIGTQFQQIQKTFALLLGTDD